MPASLIAYMPLRLRAAVGLSVRPSSPAG